MPITIRKLTPDLAHDYACFFDVTPHDEGIDAHKCYCVCWCSEDAEGKDFSTAEKRRQIAIDYVEHGILQGYLAYKGDAIVGWCNANTKADYLKCVSWRRFMSYVPLDEGARVKSVFCFVIAPEKQRQGIATRLLERVCDDAARDGFDAVEAYPYKTANFGGYTVMYQRLGFEVAAETENGLVMRKQLSTGLR